MTAANNTSGVSSRGFVTMATGRDKYYILAHNLLLSYRYHSSSKTPFAIICDRENEYTADFDQVILIDRPTHSVFDKLRLPELAPYDETIFIEADSLAYRDLNGLWEICAHAPDFGGFGIVLPLDSPRGWIPPEHLGPYRDCVREQFLHQGGVYFMRRRNLDPFIRTLRDILAHYDDFHFKLRNEEPVFILACLVHGFRPVADWFDVFCFYPTTRIARIDIRQGVLRYSQDDGILSMPGRFLVHWGTRYTREWLYRREVFRLKFRTGDRRPAILHLCTQWIAGNFFELRRKSPYRIKAAVYRVLHPSRPGGDHSRH